MKDRLPLVTLSIIVPVYNEVSNVSPLLEEIRSAVSGLNVDYEVIVIDDGSTDGTIDALREEKATFPQLKIISFMRNVGKSAAYMAGFSKAKNDYVITMDGDLQDDPGEISKLLKACRRRNGLIVGRKRHRFQNEPTKTMPSRVYNTIKNALFGLKLHDSNSGYRIMPLEAARSLRLYGDRHRFIPELLHLKGVPVSEIEVNHRPRKHGYSKYGPWRFWTGLLDLISVRFLSYYSDKPLHFFGAFGLLPLLAGSTLELYVLAMKLSGSTFQTHVAAIIIGALLIMIGVQLIATGLVCEMLVSFRNDKDLEIKSIEGFDEDDQA